MKFLAAYRCHSIPQCIGPINTRKTCFINSSRMFVECFNMSNQAWKNFKQNMKDKRMGKGRKKERSAFLKSGELVVQRLSSSVSGKAQKYSRVGPREFVCFPHEEMTIQNIKSSCEKHFASVVGSSLVCDVLRGIKDRLVKL